MKIFNPEPAGTPAITMAKDPTFPFYAQDFLVDTLRWDRSMKSLHVDLLCESWANGEIRDYDGCPLGLSKEDKAVWDRIKHKWFLDDGVWKNAKLEETRAARSSFKEKQGLNGKKGGRPPKPKPLNFEIKSEPIAFENETQNKPTGFEKETQAFLKNKPKQKPLENEYEYEKVLGEKGGAGGNEPFSDSEPMDVDLIAQKVRLTAPGYLREIEAMGVKPAAVEGWMNAFNRYLHFKGTTACTEVGWRLGLPAWLLYQDYKTANPNEYKPALYRHKNESQDAKVISLTGTARDRQTAASAAVTADLEATVSLMQSGY